MAKQEASVPTTAATTASLLFTGIEASDMGLTPELRGRAAPSFGGKSDTGAFPLNE